MSLHAGQEKKLLRGQLIIARVTLERAPGRGGGHSGTEWLPTAKRLRGSGECQNLAAVNSFEGKNGGWLIS